MSEIVTNDGRRTQESSPKAKPPAGRSALELPVFVVATALTTSSCVLVTMPRTSVSMVDLVLGPGSGCGLSGSFWPMPTMARPGTIHRLLLDRVLESEVRGRGN